MTMTDEQVRQIARAIRHLSKSSFPVAAALAGDSTDAGDVHVSRSIEHIAGSMETSSIDVARGLNHISDSIDDLAKAVQFLGDVFDRHFSGLYEGR